MAAVYFGFNPPFFGGNRGVLSRQVDERLIKNDLIQLILTVPGERVHRPNFGTRLRLMVFEIVDEAAATSLAQEILTAITANDDRLSVSEVTVNTSDDGQVVGVRVDAIIINNPLNKLFIELTFNRNGSVTITR